MSFRNSPIRYVDMDGNKWANYYDQFVANKQKEILKNSDSKKLQRELHRLISKQSEVNDAIQDLKTNDQALFYYIENLQVSKASTVECIDVNVTVKIGDIGSQPTTPWGGHHMPKIYAFLGYMPAQEGDSVKDRIIVLRTKAGMTQREFAVQVGIDSSALAKIERGIAKPSNKTLKRIETITGRHSEA